MDDSGDVAPTIIVVVGITGDLSRRKLLPAIEKIVDSQAAPCDLRVIGITRKNVSVKDVLDQMSEQTDFLSTHLEMYQMDLTNPDDYKKLDDHLKDIEREMEAGAQRLFYLSVPPQVAWPVVKLLGEAKLANFERTKLLLEKPFGVDLESAEDLVAQAKKHFREDQIYRIDHYLAKEMTQNIIVFRRDNALFRGTWSNEFIESIEIVASELIGIEGRAAFYEQTGALRDLVQSHLLQLAALTLAELPSRDEWRQIPAKRLDALRQIATPQHVSQQAIRGQYDSYRKEINNPDSATETFVSLTLWSHDPRWEGVPIRLVTGKALDKKTTEVRLHYKKLRDDEADTLILHIQPDEGVELELWAKNPGYTRDLQKLSLNFVYSNHFASLPEAYERVFVDAMRSDHSLFTTSDEVLETWRILQPVQEAWSMSEGDDLVIYRSGTSPDKISDHPNTTTKML